MSTLIRQSNLDPTAITGNTALSNADLDPTNDYLLIYDASATQLKKIAVEDVKPDLSAVDQSIIPDTDVTYDLGSATHRWRDLYLSGQTLYIGDTAMSKDENGNISIKDANTGTSKRMIVKELEFDDGAGNKVVMQRDSNGRIGLFDVDDNGVVTQTDIGISTAGNGTAALDTIAELAAAIGNNPNYAEDMEASNINMAAALVDIQDRYIQDNP